MILDPPNRPRYGVVIDEPGAPGFIADASLFNSFEDAAVDEGLEVVVGMLLPLFTGGRVPVLLKGGGGGVGPVLLREDGPVVLRGVGSVLLKGGEVPILFGGELVPMSFRGEVLAILFRGSAVVLKGSEVVPKSFKGGKVVPISLREG